MEEKIFVNLSTDHIFECATDIIGREGEGNTSRLEITVPEKLCNCSIYLDFEKPNGEKLRTPKLEVESGVAYYDVVPYLLTDRGEIKVQAVLITEIGGTWKSSIKKYFNQHSINAEDYINNYPEKEDFIVEAQRILDALSGEVAEIAEMLSNNQEFINSIVNTIEDARWVNTITGTRLRFFVGTKAEYEALEDTSNLFAIITDDTTKEEIETDIAELKTATATNTTNTATNTTDIAELDAKHTELANKFTEHEKHSFGVAVAGAKVTGSSAFNVRASDLEEGGVYLVTLRLTESDTAHTACNLAYYGVFVYRTEGINVDITEATWDCGLGQLYIRFTHDGTNLTATTCYTADGEANKYGGYFAMYKLGVI